jgi:hypothetical protein
MSYQVNKFNGELLVSVPDGSIDGTTDLRLVGKNYAGYGEIQNENIIFLLENFSNTTAPPKAIRGQLWYDTQNRKLKITHDGANFKVVGGATVSSNAPIGLAPGEFWWNSSAGTKQLFVWDGNDFELIGPQFDDNDVGVVLQNLQDTNDTSRSIIRFVAGQTTIAIGSSATFVPKETLAGFNEIKQGITLRDSVNLSDPSNLGPYRFWGTAANSDRLGGRLAADYVVSGSETFSGLVKFTGLGFELGERPLRVFYDNPNNNAVVELATPDFSHNIVFRFNANNNIKAPVILTQFGFNPAVSNEFDIGTPSLKYAQVHATTLNGNLIGNVTGNTQGTHTGNVLANNGTSLINASTRVIGSPNVQIFGNLSGDVTGNLNGVASSANTLVTAQGSIPAQLAATPGTIPIRDANGRINISGFTGGSSEYADRILVDNSATVNTPSPFQNYRPAKTTPEANTIVARTSSGNIQAVLFEGTATSARYADLAEKFLADRLYSVGTVVMVGGSAEVTAGQMGARAIGAISENPAFRMNAELNQGLFVALKGRVPVKVLGVVHKGDQLVAAENGCARVVGVNNAHLTFAIALESSSFDQEKLVEAVIL